MNPLPGPTMNPLVALQQHGQSAWLDAPHRRLISYGELKRSIEVEGWRGVTFNHVIFEKTINKSATYSQALRQLKRENEMEAKECYEQLAIWNIRDAADVLKPIYERTKRRDGYVSFEVSPHVARDTRRTFEEARRWWKVVDRDNIMITIPATPEGILASTHLISEGINVNITLLFAGETYERVAEAYLNGLEGFMARGGDVQGVASVASFFISPIDATIDALIRPILKIITDESERAVFHYLLRNVAIAQAKVTYQRFLILFSGPRWEALARRGAMTQRLLWADTAVKTPHDRDVPYVEELIGPNTVSTMTPETLEAFHNHGHLRSRLIENVEYAHNTIEILQESGISIENMSKKLLEDGLQTCTKAYDRILAAIEHSFRDEGEPKEGMIPGLSPTISGRFQRKRVKGTLR